ncbi:glycine receptor subunit alpha-3 [Lepeophtheirus salmonis]|uniref:glycine receptor subunit alpha-3 n=1 Tax=Lepeophtheirus salmonis TaxID=72036 RepID=UPI001AE9CF64|nr:glycine receptor subunit alpha-3-like [Lepeophtheirus salmonis]
MRQSIKTQHMLLMSMSSIFLIVHFLPIRGVYSDSLVSSEPPKDREEFTALKALDKLLRKYDRRSTPTNDLRKPTNVSCQLFVASLSSINTENMDYVTDTYLRQKWSDSRLSHPDIKSPLDLADPNLVKAIWKPEVFFPNAKEANFQFVTVPNVLIRIHPNGEILYILRLRLKFSCMMELSRYPLDTQICAMQISSFSKTTKELLLEWDPTHELSVTVAKDLRMPQFEMTKITTNRCHETNHMGNYSCLVAEFHLHRSIGFHLIQSYLPSVLIVAISWVSFWMDVDCVPARVTLGVITLLTVSSQVSGTSVPQTSYVKAIDVWMGVCTAFVFAALVEFTLVNYLWRKDSDPYMKFDAMTALATIHAVNATSKRNELVELDQLDSIETGIKNDGDNDSQKCNGLRQKSKPPMNLRFQAVKIDEVCRFAFPVGFGIFNIIYWAYYID